MARPSFEDLDAPMEPMETTGEPVMVFYDCEFTDLTTDSDLLSIGFIASEFNAELYIEILDAEVQRSSFFVKSEVIPLFGKHNPEILTRDQAAVRIQGWLDSLRTDRSQQLVLVSDSTWDWNHLLELFIPKPDEPNWARSFNLVGRMVQNLLHPQRAEAFARELALYHRQHKQQHHALVDTRALKHAFWESKWA
jgi:hypothetical protein